MNKGIWWMPWYKKPMKDASSCDKLRGAAKKLFTRRSPNGKTHPVNQDTLYRIHRYTDGKPVN